MYKMVSGTYDDQVMLDVVTKTEERQKTEAIAITQIAQSG